MIRLLHDDGLIFLRAETLLFELLELDVGILAVELLEEVTFPGQFHAGGNARGNEVLDLDGVKGGALVVPITALKN